MGKVRSRKVGVTDTRRELAERTKQFAIRIIRLASILPRDEVARVIGRQVLRSGTSVGAHYREAARSGTKKQFTSVLATALRDADETLYWLELLSESETMKPDQLADLINESQQLVAMLTASVKPTRS